MRRTARALVLTLALAVLLAGCHPPTLTKVRGWPGATPVFASEEEALAAAEEAYGELVALADQIFSEGGVHADRLAAFATGDFLESAVEGFHEVEAEGWRSIGKTEIRNAALQSYAPDLAPKGVIAIYVCEDISGVDVVDRSGASVVSPTRPDTTTFQAVFDFGSDGRTLLVSSREAWSNEPC